MPKEMTFSVSQINEYVKMTLESSPVLRDVYLRGEISNFKNHFKGILIYFVQRAVKFFHTSLLILHNILV